MLDTITTTAIVIILNRINTGDHARPVPLPSVGELFFSPIPPNIPIELNLEMARTAFPVFCRPEAQICLFPKHKQIKYSTTRGSASLSLFLSVSLRLKKHWFSNLPSASQYVLFHAFFGELLGFHVLGVLFKPLVLHTLFTGQSGSAR